ncbi:hypothetical protein DIPPA_26144 [Diplonema papillatum]|nr:hypothetical protein DIPPA_26144 [Diplonema papillatum]
MPAPLDDEHTCTIVDGWFDWTVQGLLAATCIGLLIAKWQCVEKNKRPFWLWAADNSKQSSGFFLAHLGNIVTSELLKGQSTSPCVWYVINIFLDCTLRVVMAYAVLAAFMRYFKKHGPSDMVFGEYGDPDVLGRRRVFCTWLKQSFLWDFVVISTRVVLSLLIWAADAPLSSVGNWIMGPLEDYTKQHGHALELVLVMAVIPTVLISFQLWVQDAFLQHHTRHDGGFVQRYCPCFSCCEPSEEGYRESVIEEFDSTSDDERRSPVVNCDVTDEEHVVSVD